MIGLHLEPPDITVPSLRYDHGHVAQLPDEPLGKVIFRSSTECGSLTTSRDGDATSGRSSGIDRAIELLEEIDITSNRWSDGQRGRNGKCNEKHRAFSSG
jgi:hypothetical protein